MRCHSQALTFKLKKDVPVADIEAMIAADNEWVKVVPNTREATIKDLTCGRHRHHADPRGPHPQAGHGTGIRRCLHHWRSALWGAAEPLRRMLRILLDASSCPCAPPAQGHGSARKLCKTTCYARCRRATPIPRKGCSGLRQSFATTLVFVSAKHCCYGAFFTFFNAGAQRHPTRKQQSAPPRASKPKQLIATMHRWKFFRTGGRCRGHRWLARARPLALSWGPSRCNRPWVSRCAQ